MKKKTNSHPSIMLVYKSRFLTYRFTSEHSTVYETGLNHFFLIAVAMLKWSLFRRTNLRKSLSKAAVTKTEHSLKSMISSSSNLFRSSLIARAFGERRKIPTVVGPSSKSWSSTIYKKSNLNFETLHSQASASNSGLASGVAIGYLHTGGLIGPLPPPPPPTAMILKFVIFWVRL